MYDRHDPQTGAESTETVDFDPYIGPIDNRGVFIHPGYDPDNNYIDDIALVELARPFAIQPLLQIVGLPTSSRRAGVVGSLANYSHNATLPTGDVAVFHASIVEDDAELKFSIAAGTASLCPGDSGSGFVTVEGGRAIVRGIVSMASVSDCKNPYGEATFTDVYAYRAWILQTMAKSDAALVGNTRMRWSGRGSYGTMTVECPASAPRSGPLNVAGVEEGITCATGQEQTASCHIDAHQRGGVMTPVLSGIKVRTLMEDGTSTTQTIAPGVNDLRVHRTFPPGAVSREYLCQVGTQLGPVGTAGKTPGKVGTAGTKNK